MTWTNTGGGDHEGEDWTPADTTVVAGIHWNIGTFTVTTGYTITVSTGVEFEVHADTVSVVGTIDGNAKGFAGNAQAAGSGPGGGGEGTYGATNGSGGGGGGYGGAGGVGGQGSQGTAGAAGAQNGTANTPIVNMGSGGGGSHSETDYGGRGGGSVFLTGEDITISGTITCNGGNGGGYSYGGCGGGAGGGILFFGDAVTISGTLSVNGGNGGNADSGGGGGGGGGGRMKVFYRTLNTIGISSSATAGTGGTSPQDAGDNGVAGNYTATKTNTTSSKTFGQEFTPNVSGKVAISAIVLHVQDVNTSGDFTLTVYNDTGKGTNYGSKSITIAATASYTWTFDNWLILPDGTSQYYFEVVADGAGDINLGREGNDNLPDDSHYFTLVELSKIIAYEIIYGLGQVNTPQIYNTADTTVKVHPANLMLCGSVYKINTDGTGTVEYNDDFTNEKWEIDSTYSGITHNSMFDRLEIADGGYLYYPIDTKNPVTGIPTLTALINITAGTPTIQIAADSGGSPDTWYDITTAIVDNVETVYDLDSTSLSLKGLTKFYWRVDCTDTGTHTCAVKSFELDVVITTIDVEHPKIGATGVSTIRCDQDDDSGIDCEISLIYRDRSWPA